MEKKRVLYVESNTDGTVGGSHFSLFFLIKGLNKDVYELIVAFYQDNYLISGYMDAGCKVIRMKKRRPLNMYQKYPELERIGKYTLLNILIMMPLKIFQKAVNYFTTFVFPAFECWAILKKEKIDLVHLNNTLLRPQEWILAALFTRAKVVAHERGINKYISLQARFWARYLKQIVCISKAVKTNLLKHGFLDKQLCLIYNALDPDDMLPLRTKESVFQEFSIPYGVPVVGMVGNIKRWKGQEILIKAMKQLRKAVPNVKCILIGDAGKYDHPYLEKLLQIIDEGDLQDCVIFTGHRKDIADIVNTFDVLVHASLEPEPFGRVLLEGMALSKPVISTTIGAGPEIVTAGETGMLVQPGDDSALAQAIKYLLTNYDEARAMGKAGHDRLKKIFTITEHVSMIDSMYRKVLK